ncbi:helix-turn-helix transcriptional regulator [Streptomyces sp. XM4193]|uniref:ArsR/SmtB family transcription factor n=1 Tax=Streptomyces sp. XM4193 TaxID=2929782 RepID=UPI0024A718C1|nr:metalloregulator ArsR/SmtB family transcription factor [Streptomyces sp. XM4193]
MSWEILADPARRRILELLAEGERTAGQLSAAVAEEFGISQPATSRHLRVLRDAGLVRCRAEGARRWYAVNPDGLREIDAWLDRFRGLWESALSSLEAEIEPGRHPRDEHRRPQR